MKMEIDLKERAVRVYREGDRVKHFLLRLTGSATVRQVSKYKFLHTDRRGHRWLYNLKSGKPVIRELT